MKNPLAQREAEHQTERGVLLREMHHRVKNNLQMISSLLNLQVEYASLKTPAEIIRASQDRISNMALLHEKLYESDNFRSADLKNYVESVARNLQAGFFKNDTTNILSCDIQSKDFSIDTLVPLGLIVNELVTNSLKHGGAEDYESVLQIKGESAGDYYRLLIRDNGSGFMFDDELNKKSLGLKLVKGLADQINTKISFSNSGGSNFELLIPLKINNI